MQSSSRFRTRARGLALGTALLVALVRVAASCILADPPSQLPTPPSEGPTIGQTLQPPPPLLIAWPTTFAVPVLLLDPPTSPSANTFNYLLQVDPPMGPIQAQGATAGGTSGTVLLEVNAGPAPAPDQSHIVVFSVYNAAGTDSAQWVYNPNEASGSCPSVDAGFYCDAAFPEAMPTDVTIPVPEGGGE
jgi:hypothetical protein